VLAVGGPTFLILGVFDHYSKTSRTRNVSLISLLLKVNLSSSTVKLPKLAMQLEMF
jgi:hypothetical protein